MKRKYWIRFFHGECCMCGRDMSYSEREYTSAKPIEHEKRHIRLPPDSCGCQH